MQVHMDYEGRKGRAPSLEGRKKGRFWREPGCPFWCGSREAAWRVDARLQTASSVLAPRTRGFQLPSTVAGRAALSSH